uniref:Uncharacterized protein n=1 Tax=Amphimedon queenslandica TaxID=400682 RepID=A0A1X7SUJ2_AMPQE
MIDISQWRASIGIWSYCQAASSRPAKGRHSHSFKAAIDDKNSGSTTSEEIASKLPAALSLIAGSSSNLIYNELHLIVCLCILLLLSGDVELNPGPIIDDQPTCHSFAKYLKPLVDWKSFALCLPGITQSDVNIIDKTRRNAQLKKRGFT